MIRKATWAIGIAAVVVVLAVCANSSLETSDARHATASYSLTASVDLGNDFTGNYSWVHGYRSSIVDAKYPCMNEFTDCLKLNADGVSVQVNDLCPSIDTPQGTWTFEFYLSADAQCSEPMPNLVCPIVPTEALAPGRNHNKIRCTTQNAAKEFEFCIYDPVTMAGYGACGDVPPPPGGSSIVGYKFYDTNMDGVQGPSEPRIPGWHVTVHGGPDEFVPRNAETDAVGEFSFDGLDTGTYQVCEVVPAGATRWVSTTGTEKSAPTGGSVAFGNVCIGGGGGHTPGFWHNANGQALLNGAQLCMLNGLNLVQGDGSAYDPVVGCPSPSVPQVDAGKAALGAWLVAGNATNMAYMLSVHLAAMELNVAYGFVSGTTVVAAPGTSLTSPAGVAGFARVIDLMAAANGSLGAHPSTPEGSAWRAEQGALESALDRANNDTGFVLPPGPGGALPCAVSYTGSEACVP